MKNDFARFRTRLNEDAAIQARLRKGEDPVSVARELGFDIAREDFESAVKDKAAELSEFELELVSGGVTADAWGKVQVKPGQEQINTQIGQQKTGI